jgi:hypothetical protein
VAVAAFFLQDLLAVIMLEAVNFSACLSSFITAA